MSNNDATTQDYDFLSSLLGVQNFGLAPPTQQDPLDLVDSVIGRSLETPPPPPMTEESILSQVDTNADGHPNFPDLMEMTTGIGSFVFVSADQEALAIDITDENTNDSEQSHTDKLEEEYEEALRDLKKAHHLHEAHLTRVIETQQEAIAGLIRNYTAEKIKLQRKVDTYLLVKAHKCNDNASLTRPLDPSTILSATQLFKVFQSLDRMKDETCSGRGKNTGGLFDPFLKCLVVNIGEFFRLGKTPAVSELHKLCKPYTKKDLTVKELKEFLMSHAMQWMRSAKEHPEMLTLVWSNFSNVIELWVPDREHLAARPKDPTKRRRICKKNW